MAASRAGILCPSAEINFAPSVQHELTEKLQMTNDKSLKHETFSEKAAGNSVTRSGDFLHFGQLFKAFGNN